MTAFDEILTTEQEAEKSIAIAKEEVATSISSARAERQTRVNDEVAKLKEAEKTALNEHESQVAKKTAEIQKGVDTQVADVEQKFAAHASDLKVTIKKKFS
jgi:vacuolar-type H+-ATPase subunit H